MPTSNRDTIISIHATMSAVHGFCILLMVGGSERSLSVSSWTSTVHVVLPILEPMARKPHTLARLCCTKHFREVLVLDIGQSRVEWKVIFMRFSVAVEMLRLTARLFKLIA